MEVQGSTAGLPGLLTSNTASWEISERAVVCSFGEGLRGGQKKLEVHLFSTLRHYSKVKHVQYLTCGPESELLAMVHISVRSVC